MVKEISFGTSGMRGLMGEGPDRLNPQTVAKAALGLARHLKKGVVVIGYDNRHNSRLFAEISARVLLASNIKTLVFNEIRPSPYLSFVIRHLQCDAGIMITASHNPKEYNGFEVYGPEGGEIAPDVEEKIVKEIKEIQGEVAMADPSLVEWVPLDAWDKAYFKAIEPLQRYRLENQKGGSELNIIYSSLHGTGITLAPRALKGWGFTTIDFVQQQIVPDPDFQTLMAPNPEEKEALKLGIEKLEKTKADILIVNDCDADRIGIVVMHEGKARIVNGNEFAAICAHHICKAGGYPKNGAFIISYVTTELIKVMASKFEIACFEVPTGFKYIAEMINSWDKTQEYVFLFGAEESFGCLLGTYCRNKDGIAADCFISEIALQMKKQGKTVIDLLYEIYRTYGIFRERQHSLKFSEDEKGLKKRSEIMQMLRTKPPGSIGEKKVVFIEDFLPKNHVPNSDMILFRLEDESKIIVRPSGTEPKLRIHITCHVKKFDSIDTGILAGDKHVEHLLNSFIEQVG